MIPHNGISKPLSLAFSFFCCLNVSQDVLAIFPFLYIYLSRTYYRRAYASSSRGFSPGLLLNFLIGQLRLVCRRRFRGELFSVSRCRYRFTEGIERHAPSLNIVLPVRCHSLVCSTKHADKIHKRFANNVEEDTRENGNEFDETGRLADCVQRLNGRTRDARGNWFKWIMTRNNASVPLWKEPILWRRGHFRVLAWNCFRLSSGTAGNSASNARFQAGNERSF